MNKEAIDTALSSKVIPVDNILSENGEKLRMTPNYQTFSDRKLDYLIKTKITFYLYNSKEIINSNHS